ncbi:MAG: GNAT family N-acetyltransferase [Candidatus Cloacimonadales bacterium]|nr:GNAT family N-acetyltransferase [Candidatus Cloacimonadales bacterium]
MKIVDLTEKHHKTYFCCLEDWSDEMKEAGDHKQKWFEKMKDEGLRVKLALDEKENVCGMIQYAPIEYSPAAGKDLYFIFCIWVHGYKGKGVGNMQKKGMGKALIQAAEMDVKQIGAKGIAAWGLSQPFWIPSAFYKNFGYELADAMGIQELVWKPFTKDAHPPKWRKPEKKPIKISGKVTITAFISGWCTTYNVGFENFRKAAAEFDDKVESKLSKL